MSIHRRDHCRLRWLPVGLSGGCLVTGRHFVADGGIARWMMVREQLLRLPDNRLELRQPLLDPGGKGRIDADEERAFTAFLTGLFDDGRD